MINIIVICLEPIDDWGTVTQIGIALLFGIISIYLAISDRKKSRLIKELKAQTRLLFDHNKILLENLDAQLQFVNYNSDNKELVVKNIGRKLSLIKCHCSSQAGYFPVFPSNDVSFGQEIKVDLATLQFTKVEFSIKDIGSNIYHQNLNLSNGNFESSRKVK